MVQHVFKYSRKSLRVLGSVGEPINPSAWRFYLYSDFSFHMVIIEIDLTDFVSCRWFFNVVGDSRCPISDTWWQTETGGFMVSCRSCCRTSWCKHCSFNYQHLFLITRIQFFLIDVTISDHRYFCSVISDRSLPCLVLGLRNLVPPPFLSLEFRSEQNLNYNTTLKHPLSFLSQKKIPLPLNNLSFLAACNCGWEGTRDWRRV